MSSQSEWLYTKTGRVIVYWPLSATPSIAYFAYEHSITTILLPLRILLADKRRARRIGNYYSACNNSVL